MMPHWAELKPSVGFHCPDVAATGRRLELGLTSQPLA
jgi:hypothetical protein